MRFFQANSRPCLQQESSELLGKTDQIKHRGKEPAKLKCSPLCPDALTLRALKYRDIKFSKTQFPERALLNEDHVISAFLRFRKPLTVESGRNVEMAHIDDAIKSFCKRGYRPSDSVLLRAMAGFFFIFCQISSLK